MVDKASIYLNALQRGYRVDEYNVTSTGTGVIFVMAPFNANRVLIYLDAVNGSTSEIAFRMQSGLLVSFFPTSTGFVDWYAVSQHYLVPSFEVICRNSVVGQTYVGFGLIKQ